MSCTVVALPILLLNIVSVVTAAATVTTAVRASASAEINETIQDYTKLNEETNNIDNIYQGENYLTVNNIIEKDFETPFMDEEILVKTLTEHGLQNISIQDGVVAGTIETFSLKFEKPSAELPYHLYITCNQNNDAEEKVNDISAEYALNVQEAAYLSIVEKLKDQNMQIEEETVEDDNTIVLTINLE